MKKTKVNLNTITVEYGSYEEQSSHENVIYKTKAIRTISEFEFYKKYLEIKSVIGFVSIDGEKLDISLKPLQIELMALIMTKDLDFNVNWKNDSQQLRDLGQELGRSKESCYKSYIILKKKKYFITTEDKLVIPNEEINNLRKKVKRHIRENGHSTCDINFEFCIA
jgi:hypothetical protein